MREVKQNRIAEILRRLAAEFIHDNATKTSLITVTRVELSQTGKESRAIRRQATYRWIQEDSGSG
jgi:ribosome-binding factor A